MAVTWTPWILGTGLQQEQNMLWTTEPCPEPIGVVLICVFLVPKEYRVGYFSVYLLANCTYSVQLTFINWVIWFFFSGGDCLFSVHILDNNDLAHDLASHFYWSSLWELSGTGNTSKFFSMEPWKDTHGQSPCPGWSLMSETGRLFMTSWASRRQAERS